VEILEVAPRAGLEPATLRLTEKAAVVPPVAAHCREAPDHELDPINTAAIDDQRDAAVSRPNPRLDVSKGQVKGKGKSG
jgi:hypothetical protein